MAHWAGQAVSTSLGWVSGALLVAPSDPEGANFPPGPRGFGPVPHQRLTFPSIMLASADDPYIRPDRARAHAEACGSRFALLENSGHINAASGYGAWEAGYALLSSLRETV